MYDEAKTTAQEIDDKTAVAYVLSGRGETLYERGDLASAHESYEQSLAIRKQTGEKQTAAESALALARLAIDEGHAAEAESVIRKYKEQFHQDQQADDELAATITLVDTLLAGSKISEAENEIAQGKSLAARSGNKLLQLRFNIAAARVEGASGKAASAAAHLQSTVQDATSHRLLDVAFEARLAILEVKQKSLRPEAVQSESVSLESAARKSGFDLIAIKATKLRSAAN
jgi:tetratricopeptide (TPR) repeat protein